MPMYLRTGRTGLDRWRTGGPEETDVETGDVPHSPITTLADDLHLKVVDPAGRWDGVGGPHRGRVFGGLPVSYRWDDEDVQPWQTNRLVSRYLSSRLAETDVAG